MKINSLININDGDLILFFLWSINISLFNILNVLVIKILMRFGVIHIKFGIKIKVKIVLIQLKLVFIIKVDGSKILNRFIIIFYEVFI